MKLTDYIELSFSNLWKMKLRTFLTTFGVIIGIGALVSMISFGKGMQKNVTDTFKSLELFNFITVFSEPPKFQKFDGSRKKNEAKEKRPEENQLDDNAIEKIMKFKGVEAAFPDIRFPAELSFNNKKEFSLIQVLPAKFVTSKLLKLRAGKPYLSHDEDVLIISDSLLRKFGIKEFSAAIGKKIKLSTIIFDFTSFNPLELTAFLQREKLPLSKETYVFTISGISERMRFGGPSPLRSDVYIAPGAAGRMKKLSFTNLWDLFQTPGGKRGYSLVNVKLSSPKAVDSVKTQIEKMGFRTFALIDQLEEIKTGFLYMDMILAAVGMIAIVVASLGIINTMVMSILERYSEIGIMKAVGASDRDIKKIFLFESGVIGFLGGTFGLGLGWLVSTLINRIINYFLAKQGVPFIEYFSFPLWLCLGAVLFAVLVSLVSGIYPALRAARVDPVVALRHD